MNSSTAQMDAPKSVCKVLILGASSESTKFLDLLLRECVSVVCTDRNPALPQEFLQEHQDHLKCYGIDFSESDKLDELIHSEHITHTLALPVGRSLVNLGTINDRYGFKGPSFRAVDILTDKLKMHRFCEEKNINHSNYICLEDNSPEAIAKAVDEIESKLSYPMIVKPSMGSGSLGVRILNSREELLSYRIPERFDSCPLLFEQMLQGTEYSCNVMTDGSAKCYCIGLFKKQISAAPFRQEVAYFMDDYSSVFEEIRPLIERLSTELNLTNCFINADIIVADDGKVYGIDIAPRLGGNSLIDLLLLNGNNPLQLFKRSHIDGAPIEVNTQRPAMMAFFNFDTTFTYKPVTAPAAEAAASAATTTAESATAACASTQDAAAGRNCTYNAQLSKDIELFSEEERSHIISLKNNLKPGDQLGPMSCGVDCQRGHITVSHDSVAQAQAIVKKYFDLISSAR